MTIKELLELNENDVLMNVTIWDKTSNILYYGIKARIPDDLLEKQVLVFAVDVGDLSITII